MVTFKAKNKNGEVVNFKFTNFHKLIADCNTDGRQIEYPENDAVVFDAEADGTPLPLIEKKTLGTVIEILTMLSMF